jgi:hypothetical protein
VLTKSLPERVGFSFYFLSWASALQTPGILIIPHPGQIVNRQFAQIFYLPFSRKTPCVKLPIDISIKICYNLYRKSSKETKENDNYGLGIDFLGGVPHRGFYWDVCLLFPSA